MQDEGDCFEIPNVSTALDCSNRYIVAMRLLTFRNNYLWVMRGTWLFLLREHKWISTPFIDFSRQIKKTQICRLYEITTENVRILH